DASATQIPSSNRAYEVGDRGALGDLADFMGSGTQQANYWITPDVYNQLFLGLDPGKKANAVRRAAPQRVLFFSGIMNAKGETKVKPWYSLSSTEVVTDTTGNMQIQAVDASGAVLASHAISVRFFVLSNPPVTADW